MTIKSGPFNGMDRIWKAEDFARYFATFIGNGVFPNPSNGLQVCEFENMKTVIKPGKGWINGYFLFSDSDYVLQHDLADGVVKRIDRIVMRLNFLSRQIEIDIKKGAFASVPVPPALQRDADAYELALADVLINNGSTQITQANITDTRLNNELCGIVHGTVNQVDTTTLFNQYQSWINQQKNIYETDLEDWTDEEKALFLSWRQQEETDFQTWLTRLESILDENTAGNLLNMIDGLTTDLQNHTNTKASLTQEGHVQLSNSINSDDEQKAATPKAIKDALLSVGVTGENGDSGYIKFGNGLYIQWGRSTGDNGSFPITFPNKCFNVFVEKINFSGNHVYVTGLDKSGFTLGSLISDFYFIAIGY